MACRGEWQGGRVRLRRQLVCWPDRGFSPADAPTVSPPTSDPSLISSPPSRPPPSLCMSFHSIAQPTLPSTFGRRDLSR